jgi:hypothetical protein
VDEEARGETVVDGKGLERKVLRTRVDLARRGMSPVAQQEQAGCVQGEARRESSPKAAPPLGS